MTAETSNARGDLQAVLQEMRERQVARRFKSQTLINWADRIERGDIDLRRTDAALRALAQQPAAVDGAMQ